MNLTRNSANEWQLHDQKQQLEKKNTRNESFGMKQPHKMHHEITMGHNFCIGCVAHILNAFDNNNFAEVHGHLKCGNRVRPMIEIFNLI